MRHHSILKANIAGVSGPHKTLHAQHSVEAAGHPPCQQQRRASRLALTSSLIGQREDACKGAP